MSDCDSLQTVAWVFAAAAVVFIGVGLFIDWHSRRLRASLAIVERAADRAAASWRALEAADVPAHTARAYLAARGPSQSHAQDTLENALDAYDSALEAERRRVLAEHTS